jgi:hypothetical protein
MINITKFPVVIFTSPRTGSTAFAHYLKKQNPTKQYFIEPILDQNQMIEFTRVFNSTNDYIIKVMGETIVKPNWEVPQHPQYMIDKMLSAETYKIKLYRRNVIEQVASYYIGSIRNYWEYNEDNVLNFNVNDNIKIDLPKIQRAIRIIKYNNEVIDIIKADITLYYEDINYFDNRTVLTPKPHNYAELLRVVEHFYPTQSSKA